MTAYEKDLDDIMYENYVCMVCGWWVQPNIIDECGCEEEWFVLEMNVILKLQQVTNILNNVRDVCAFWEGGLNEVWM